MKDDKLDKITLINVPMSKLEETWKVREYDIIESDCPYDFATRLALKEWSYSDDVVIAIIDYEFVKPDEELSSMLEGTLLGNNKIEKKHSIPNNLIN